MLKIYEIYANEVEGDYGPEYPYETNEDDLFETIDTDEITEELIQKIKDILFDKIVSMKTIDEYDTKIGWKFKPMFKNPKKDWIEVDKNKNGTVEIYFVYDYEMKGFVIIKI